MKNVKQYIEGFVNSFIVVDHTEDDGLLNLNWLLQYSLKLKGYTLSESDEILDKYKNYVETYYKKNKALYDKWNVDE